MSEYEELVTKLTQLSAELLPSHERTCMEAAAAIRSLEQRWQWQDISTAPKDGTKIRYRRIQDDEVLFEGVAAWRAVNFPELEAHPIDGDVYAPAVQATGWMMPDVEKRVPEPTHWQPLPLPPTT